MSLRARLSGFLDLVERFPAEFCAATFSVVFLVAVFVGPWIALAAAGFAAFVQYMLVKKACWLRDQAVSREGEANARALFLRTELNRTKNSSPFEDPETGLGSRRQFEEAWARQLARQKRWGESFSVAVLRVRDASGDGEEALPMEQACTVAAALVAECRAEDVVCRVDRDLFVVLLAAAGREGAERFAARVCRSLSRPADEGSETPFEVASGVIQWSEEMTTAPLMVKLAVRELAKRQAAEARMAREQRKAS